MTTVLRPTVILGFGGSGHTACLTFKRRFIERYGSVPPIIRFLCFDTTSPTEYVEQTDNGLSVILEPHEHRVIQVSNPAALVNGSNEHIDAWFPDVPITAIIAGAGQVRSRGRLALFAKFSDVFGRIRQVIDDVMNIKNQKQMYADRFMVSDRGGVEVYIIGSLAGGTGSGMFMDIAFIVRHLLDSLSNVTAVLALPRIFADKPGTHNIKSNTYGALKEIEHFWNLSPRNPLMIDYGTLQITADRPPFDLVYLIDSINEAGKVITESSELLTLIADGLFVQIASQIGVDSNNTVDNIKTQLAVAGRVRGRFTSYCSFGKSQLVLPVQQYKVMQLTDAKSLINDGILNGFNPESELQGAVELFIQDQKLREEKVDEVIDALNERPEGGQMRFLFSIGQIKFDQTALKAIKDIRLIQLSKVEQKISETINANRERLYNQVCTAITTWLEQTINQPNSLSYAKKFLTKLLAQLKLYQHLMESESQEEREKLKSLSFSTIENDINEAVKAWLGTEGKVRRACENYRGLANREFDLYLQIARRDQAAQLYGMLYAHVEHLKLKCDRICTNLDSAYKGIQKDYLDNTIKRSSGNTWEHTIRCFDPEKHRPAILPTEFLQWYKQKYGTISDWADKSFETVQQEIMEFISDRYRSLTEMSIDEVLRRSDPNEVKQDLAQTADLAVPLWRYDEGKIPVTNRGMIDEMFHYGVADAGSTILSDLQLSGSVPAGMGATAPSFISTGDPNRITLFRIKVGIPLFAIQGIEEMERHYKDPDRIFKHLHRDWKSFANIIPCEDETNAIQWFAIALAPEPFSLIVRRGKSYYARSQQAKLADNGELNLGAERQKVFALFQKNIALAKEMQQQIEYITESKGEENIKTVLGAYIEQLLKQTSDGKFDPLIKEQVEAEIVAISEYIYQLGIIH